MHPSGKPHPQPSQPPFTKLLVFFATANANSSVAASSQQKGIPMDLIECECDITEFCDGQCDLNLPEGELWPVDYGDDYPYEPGERLLLKRDPRAPHAKSRATDD